jgi:hypothetical protein
MAGFSHRQSHITKAETFDWPKRCHFGEAAVYMYVLCFEKMGLKKRVSTILRNFLNFHFSQKQVLAT